MQWFETATMAEWIIERGALLLSSLRSSSLIVCSLSTAELLLLLPLAKRIEKKQIIFLTYSTNGINVLVSCFFPVHTSNFLLLSFSCWIHGSLNTFGGLFGLLTLGFYVCNTNRRPGQTLESPARCWRGSKYSVDHRERPLCLNAFAAGWLDNFRELSYFSFNDLLLYWFCIARHCSPFWQTPSNWCGMIHLCLHFRINLEFFLLINRFLLLCEQVEQMHTFYLKLYGWHWRLIT